MCVFEPNSVNVEFIDSPGLSAVDSMLIGMVEQSGGVNCGAPS